MSTAVLGAGVPAAAPPQGPGTARRLRLRLVGFAPLCLVGTLAWAQLVRPAATDWALGTAALCALAGLALLRIARAEGRRRGALLLALALVLAGAVLLLAGVPVRLLVPDRWGRLVSGIAGGLRALPGAPVPYDGSDPWVRIALLAGGGLLAAIGVLQALWPRGRGALSGSVRAAAVTLGVLYALPVIQHPPARPYLAGAIFMLALGAFLFADRLTRTQAIPAAVLLVLAAVGGAALAPALARDRPWLDFQHIADDIANAGTVRYDWNHSYGPLHWPRQGHPLLRFKAQVPTYWKAEVLDTFDGREWRHSGSVAPFEPDTEVNPNNPQWVQTVRVRDTGLLSNDFVTAGEALQVSRAQTRPIGAGGGTFVLDRGTLRPGSTYSVRAYTPRPSTTQLVEAGSDYPSFAREWLRVQLPDIYGRAAPRDSGGSAVEVSFPPWSTGQAALVSFPGVGIRQDDGISFVRHSALRRIYALAQRLRARATSPLDFLQRVEDRVRRGAVYTETPARHANPLDAFLFDDRRGYCQHFSGAMALLLRMGGVPARVATGFSPGVLDHSTGEWVVTDLDAHSWVEAYFPHVGWVTFDPTPAASPAHAQTADASAALRQRRGRRLLGADTPTSSTQAARSVTPRGRPWWQVAAWITLALLLAGAAVALPALRRRRRAAAGTPGDPELAELERALRRSGRPAAPGVTLTELERALSGGGEGDGYLEALVARRFGRGGPPPSPAARRALRRELAAGLGKLGRLQALWALPPRPRRPRLRARRPSARAVP
ncbi:MAG TPA: transglutaminase domain-containing protein [Solirubrobacteraceae bacterium]